MYLETAILNQKSDCKRVFSLALITQRRRNSFMMTKLGIEIALRNKIKTNLGILKCNFLRRSSTKISILKMEKYLKANSLMKWSVG